MFSCFLLTNKSLNVFEDSKGKGTAFQWNPFFDFSLKISRDSESFMSFGNMSHIVGAKKETVSVPYLTEFTLRLVRTLFPRKL